MNIENKISSIAKRYHELAAETTLVLIGMAEKGLRIEPEMALNRDYFVTNSKDEDCAFCGIGLNTLDSSEVVVYLMPIHGEDAHTIVPQSLRFMSIEDKYYIIQHIENYLKLEKVRNPRMKCC